MLNKNFNKKVKYTKSYSPISLKAIPATIVEYEDGIYMLKKDENSKEYKCLIEKDKDFYYSSTKENFHRDKNCFFFIINSSLKCNLDCSFCYETDRNEISLANLKSLVKNYENKTFVLAGKEPTCRKELPELIRTVAKKNFVSIATNGLKLSNYSYLKKLKKAGLRHILFSLNALNDDILFKMHGQRVLDKKLRALENIRRLKIPIILSMTLVRGLNEGEISKVFSLCAENPRQFYEIRIRSMTSFGKHSQADSFCLSELTKLVCSKLKIDHKNLNHEYKFIDSFNRFLHIRPMIRKSCSNYFHVKVDSRNYLKSFGDMVYSSNNNLFKKYFLIIYFSYPFVVNFVKNIFRKNKHFSNPNFIRVSMRSWPNIFNVDLDEVDRKCATCLVNRGVMDSFCLANIKRSFNYKKDYGNENL